MPSDTSSFSPADQTSEFYKQLVLTTKYFLHLLLQFLSNGNERHDEVRAVGGNEMRESGGEDTGPVSHRAIAFMDEFQFLAYV